MYIHILRITYITLLRVANSSLTGHVDFIVYVMSLITSCGQAASLRS